MRKKLTRRLALLGLAGALTAPVLTPTPAAADDAVNLRFATVGIGSAWYVYGTGIAELAKANLHAGSTIDVLPIAGGVGNMKLIQNGETEMAITFAHTAGEACRGEGAFDKKMDKVRGLIGGLDTYYYGGFATVKSGIKSWDDVVSGKPVRLIHTKVGGTGELGLRQLLGFYGSGKDKLAAAGGYAKSLKRAETAAAIADGNADMWAHVVTKGHPVATQLTTTTDMVMLPISPAVIKKMETVGWAPSEVPANTFKGQTRPVPTVAAVSSIVVSSDMADEVAYGIAKAIVEGSAKLASIHAALGDFSPERGVVPLLNGNCPMHPGAVKYFKEKKLM